MVGGRAGTLRARLERLQERLIARALAPWEADMRQAARQSGHPYAGIRAIMAATVTFYDGQPADLCGCIEAEPLVRWLVGRYDLDAEAEAELWARAQEGAEEHEAHASTT